MEPRSGRRDEAEALLVDVGVVEIAGGVQIGFETLRRRRTRQPAALILRPLDFDDLGPQSPEPPCGPWPGPHPAEIHHANVFKGSRSRHGVVLRLGRTGDDAADRQTVDCRPRTVNG